jgi:hypothetical protein
LSRRAARAINSRMAAKKRSSSKRSVARAPKRAASKAKRAAPKTARAKAPRIKAPRPAAASKLSGDPGAAFCQAVESALKRGEPQAINDEMLRRVLTAAVRVYAAKVEEAGYEIAPFRENTITATETVVAACAMIRAADLNLFDVAMWFRRPVASEQ